MGINRMDNIIPFSVPWKLRSESGCNENSIIKIYTLENICGSWTLQYTFAETP